MVNLSLSNVISIGFSVIHDDTAAQRARTNPDEMLQNKTKMRKWRAHFGVLPVVCIDILNMFDDRDIHCKIEHLFWALIYLKSYDTEDKLASYLSVSNKTLRQHIWKTLRQMKGLSKDVVSFFMKKLKKVINMHLINLFLILFFISLQICWKNRLINHDGREGLITVDTTDCPINEPTPFSTKNYSFKFKGPAARFEVGVATQSSNIVWVSGPHQPHQNDLIIFRKQLKLMLDDGEKAIADGIYRGEPNKIQRKGDASGRLDNYVARARQETVFGEMKKYRCLTTKFRHGRLKHQDVFFSIAVLVQIQIQHKPLFEVRC